jgi:hypothetical protein
MLRYNSILYKKIEEIMGFLQEVILYQFTNKNYLIIKNHKLLINVFSKII